MNPVTIASLLLGAAAVGAVVLAVAAFRRPLPHLAKTLTALTVTDDLMLTGAAPVGSAPASLLDRWGTVLISTGRLTPSHKQLAQLRLRNISVARFYGERLAAAGICAVMIAMLWWAAVQIGGPVGYAVPAGAVLAAAAVGWFLPALRIASSAQQVTEDASEALLVYIDLVVLGRMANKHARAALTEAANVCDNPVFLQHPPSPRPGRAGTGAAVGRTAAARGPARPAPDRRHRRHRRPPRRGSQPGGRVPCPRRRAPQRLRRPSATGGRPHHPADGAAEVPAGHGGVAGDHLAAPDEDRELT